MNTQVPNKPNNRKTAFILIAVVLGMFAFGFALVPFYNLACKVLGINGKTNEQAYAVDPNIQVDTSRTVTVQFLATRNDELPWDFKPEDPTIEVHPGETYRTAYFAHNHTDDDMIIQAIPSVTPSEAAKYIRKTECFCFSQQYFDADEAMDMPLLFRLDPDLPEHIHTITLSYTLFNAGKYAGKKPQGKAGRIS